MSSAMSCFAFLFLSTLSLRRATYKHRSFEKWQTFLSTLSLRRATRAENANESHSPNFYPRSPCGERRKPEQYGLKWACISIHALLAESDNLRNQRQEHQDIFLSTLSLRRATHSNAISISKGFTFLSTLSLRRATS